MNAQQAYEGIVAHFSQPSAKFGYEIRNPDSKCVYRGYSDPASPIRCAGGCLMPDDLYEPRFEGIGISSLIGDDLPKDHPLVEMFGGDFGTLDFIHEAQRLHDRNANSKEKCMTNFLMQLHGLAGKHHLDVK